jgi:aminoglycoside phosphotransferase (APT) family kinase protein
MESITKNRQSLPALRVMVTRGYGAAQVPSGDDWVAELGDGWFNVAYRIRLRDGRLVVLKIAPPAGVEVLTHERGAMATELAALALIRSRTTVPVPAVDFADHSRELCDADYFFMPYVDADNFGLMREKLSPAVAAAYDEQLGAANRELNSIRGPAFGPLGGPGVATWREQYTAMFENVLRDGARRHVDLGWDYDTFRAVLADHAHCLDEVTEPRFVAGDLWDGNALIRDGKIVSIIDHERAYFGDPLAEAGFAATELPAFGDPAAFLRGYGKTGLTPGERIRRRLYCLQLTLIMVIETVYRGRTDTNQLDWSRGQVTEIMRALGRTH